MTKQTKSDTQAARDRPELIQVTPEMVDAGVNVLFDVEFELLSPSWTEHELVERIICAALRSRNAQAAPSSQR